ncbi:Protein DETOXIFICATION 35 [Orobanche minor]
MLGVYMQRSIIILFTTCILLLPLYVFATPVLKLLGQADDIGNPAGVYTLLIIPQLFSLSITFPSQKFLQAQSKVSVLAWIAFLALASQVFLCWLFINVLDWGVGGAALAFDLTGWATAVAQFVYVVGWCKDVWKGFSWSAFKEIWVFVRLSLASAVMLCLEIWYMMSIIVLTGHLDNAVSAVGSLSICMNVNGWESMIFIGINAAISLERARIRTPKSREILCIYDSLPVPPDRDSLYDYRPCNKKPFRCNFHRQQRYATSLLGITMVLNSVAVGGGWQAVVAYINLACYYLFGLPLGYVLGYVANLGVVGLWGGMIVGTATQTLLLLLVLYKTNWKKEVEQTTERMRKWGGQDIVMENPAIGKLPIRNG